MSLPFVPVLQLVAEEVVKVPSQIESLLPAASLRVQASSLCILESATRLARKCKRRRLCVRDIERAVELEFGERPLYMYSESEKGLEAFPANKVSSPLLVFQDIEIKLSDLVTNPSLPSVPLAPTFFMHWLAVEGVQIANVENALLSSRSQENPVAVATAMIGEQEELSSFILTKELKLYFSKMVETLVNAENTFEQPSNQVHNALSSITNDEGLDRLVPHFVTFLCDRINNPATTLSGLWTCLRLAHALVRNQLVHNMDFYMDKLLPCVLSCVLRKSLVSHELGVSENHWAFREFGATILGEICTKFAGSYAGIQSRVSHVYLQALQLDKPLTTQFGGIVGLSRLGSLVVDSVLLQWLIAQPEYGQRLVTLVTPNKEEEGTEEAFVQRMEALQVLHAIKSALMSSRSREAFSVLRELGFEHQGLPQSDLGRIFV